MSFYFYFFSLKIWTILKENGMIFIYNKKIIIEKGMFMGEFEININGLIK